MPKEFDHPKKVSINIQTFNDNQCFKCCLIKYLNPFDHHPARITTVHRMLESKLDFKDKKFPFKIRDSHKIEKRNRVGISIFSYKNTKKYLLYVYKNRLLNKSTIIGKKRQ